MWNRDRQVLRDIEAMGGYLSDASTGLSWLWQRPNRSVVFDYTPITDDSLKVLQPLKFIGYLKLRRTSVDGSFLEHLPCCHTLHCLDLGESHFCDRNAKWLLNCTELRWIFLDSTELSDIGLEVISRHPTITNIYLNHLKITSKGILSLSRLKSQLDLVELCNVQIDEPEKERLNSLFNQDQLRWEYKQTFEEQLKELLPNGANQ